MREGCKAFVISPIGDPGSALRAHADWVFNEIIRKACERAGAGREAINVLRSDHVSLPGAITDQVISAIMKDRVIFAVLAGDRPNVYYELALALAAGRPAVVLRHEGKGGETTHFDVKDIRAIGYSYDGTHGPAPEATIAEVTKAITSVLDADAYQRSAFGGLDALGRGYREYEFKQAFRDIDIPSYYKVFVDATKHVGLQGITLMHFARQDFFWNVKRFDKDAGKDVDDSLSFFDIVRAKVLFDAVDVRIVMMHEQNPALPHLTRFLGRKPFTQSIAMTRDEIKRSFENWSALKLELDAKGPERADGRKGKLDVVQLVHGIVNYRLTVTDQVMIISPYFNIFPFNSQGPALVVHKDTSFYENIYREFVDRIESNNLAAAALKEHGSLEIVSPTQARG